MLKALIFGLWSAGITAGMIVMLDPGEKPEAEGAAGGEQSAPVLPGYVEPQQLIASVILPGKISGYLFATAALEIDTNVRAKLTIPVDMIAQDAFASLVIGNDDFLFPKVDSLDASKLRQGLIDQINESAGGELVLSAYLSNVNFLAAGEARRKKDLRSVILQEPTNAPVKKKKKK